MICQFKFSHAEKKVFRCFVFSPLFFNTPTQNVHLSSHLSLRACALPYRATVFLRLSAVSFCFSPMHADQSVLTAPTRDAHTLSSLPHPKALSPSTPLLCVVRTPLSLSLPLGRGTCIFFLFNYLRHVSTFIGGRVLFYVVVVSNCPHWHLLLSPLPPKDLVPVEEEEEEEEEGVVQPTFFVFGGVRSPFFSFLLCPPSLPFFSHYSFLYSPRTKPNHCRGGVMRAGLFSTTHFYKPCCLSWLLSRFRCSSSEFFFFFFFGRLPVQFFPYLYRSVQAVTTLVQPTKPSTQPPPPINKQGICCF